MRLRHGLCAGVSNASAASVTTASDVSVVTLAPLRALVIAFFAPMVHPTTVEEFTSGL